VSIEQRALRRVTPLVGTLGHGGAQPAAPPQRIRRDWTIEVRVGLGTLIEENF
jgi:hypothetical protein